MILTNQLGKLKEKSTYKVLLLPEAKEDIREAAVWYEKQQKGLGKRFTEEIKTKVDFLKQNPTAVSVWHNSVRVAVLNIFPFLIHYLLEEEDSKIVIIAVFHSSRNPELWSKRNK